MKFWDDLDWIGLDAYFPLESQGVIPAKSENMLQKALYYYGKVTSWAQSTFPN